MAATSQRASSFTRHLDWELRLSSSEGQVLSRPRRTSDRASRKGSLSRLCRYPMPDDQQLVEPVESRH